MSRQVKILIVVPSCVLLLSFFAWLYQSSHQSLISTQPPQPYIPDAVAKEKIALWPARKGSRWGYINRAGEFAIQPQFEAAARFKEGRAAVRIEGKIGYIDKTGALIIQPQFTNEFLNSYFQEGRAGFRDGIVFRPFRFFGITPHKGFIDATGKKVINARFRSAGEFREGLTWVVQQQLFPRRYKYGFIDRDGNQVIDYVFDEAREFSEGFAPVRKDRRWFFINQSGHEVFGQSFEYVHSFSEGLAAAKIEGRYGFLDRTGKWTIRPFYDAVCNYSEGLCAIKVGRQWGYVNHEGREVIAPQFSLAGNFSEGLAPVQLEKKFGYIDKTGKIVIPLQFRTAEAFKDGVAYVTLLAEDRFRSAYIDSSGNVFWQED
ncbi:MAG: WG repeat-containing protein [Acidobacteria bacterium]|nr:WG repeat-containing protein [Acidobacteriota bacterium]